jgi:hypothetical protein
MYSKHWSRRKLGFAAFMCFKNKAALTHHLTRAAAYIYRFENQTAVCIYCIDDYQRFWAIEIVISPIMTSETQQRLVYASKTKQFLTTWMIQPSFAHLKQQEQLSAFKTKQRITLQMTRAAAHLSLQEPSVGFDQSQRLTLQGVLGNIDDCLLGSAVMFYSLALILTSPASQRKTSNISDELIDPKTNIITNTSSAPGASTRMRDGLVYRIWCAANIVPSKSCVILFSSRGIPSL